MKHLLLALLALTACTDDTTGTGMDIHNPGPFGTLRADGTWSLNVTYLPGGSCAQSGTHELVLTVVDGPSGYAITADSPLTVTGTTTCTKTGCTLDLSADNQSLGQAFAFSVTGSDADVVIGQGTLTISGTSACSQTFSINGTWAP